MKTYHAESAHAGLAAAAEAGLSFDEFAHAAVDQLERAIPFDSIRVGLADPATADLLQSVHDRFGQDLDADGFFID